MIFLKESGDDIHADITNAGQTHPKLIKQYRKQNKPRKKNKTFLIRNKVYLLIYTCEYMQLKHNSHSCRGRPLALWFHKVLGFLPSFIIYTYVAQATQMAFANDGF